jgi:ArsR family transcriptional regulator
MQKNAGAYATIMKALSDETRVRIFSMLDQGELCACKIQEEFIISQPTLSYHMKILCDCGLVSGRRDGIWMKYSINKEQLDFLRNWLNQITIEEKAPSSTECCGCKSA